MTTTSKKKVNQWVWIIVIAIVTFILALGLLSLGKSKSANGEDGHDHGAESTHVEEGTEKKSSNKHEHGDGHEHESEAHGDEDGHDEEGIELSSQQIEDHGIQLATAELGQVNQAASYPARLVVNTDRQAHVSPSFSGRVEAVNVDLGQSVKKGQTLAVLLVPDLVDQQANLRLAEVNLQLAEQDYQREKSLFNQGISAKQDYQRTYNAYRQAQIQVQSARSRLTAFGASGNSNGRYVLTAPMSGVVSAKDVVVGENVQLADQLFTINQLDQLWLEFILPATDAQIISPNQKLTFKSLQTGNSFDAQVQSLTTEADVQTGRLQVRAKVNSNSQELRPNLMVNVELPKQNSQQALRVAKAAIQQIEGKATIFVATTSDHGVSFQPHPVELGGSSSDGQWIEVKKGLSAAQSYAAQGSFILKSELEKGEAAHEH